MSQVYLKMKIMSLTAEAKIIRREERRWYGGSTLRAGLHGHRVWDVRTEARVALLAYGYLRGKTYAQLEVNPRFPPSWARVRDLVVKYGDDKRVPREVLEAWGSDTTPLVRAGPSQRVGGVKV